MGLGLIASITDFRHWGRQSQLNIIGFRVKTLIHTTLIITFTTTPTALRFYDQFPTEQTKQYERQSYHSSSTQDQNRDSQTVGNFPCFCVFGNMTSNLCTMLLLLAALVPCVLYVPQPVQGASVLPEGSRGPPAKA